jgi:hypothetical protein
VTHCLFTNGGAQTRLRPFRSNGGRYEKGAPSSGEKNVTSPRRTIHPAEAAGHLSVRRQEVAHHHLDLYVRRGRAA